MSEIVQSLTFTLPGPSPHSIVPDLLDASQAARLLSVCPRTLWAISSPRGELPVITIGRRRLYDLRDLDAYIARQRRGGVA